MQEVKIKSSEEKKQDLIPTLAWRERYDKRKANFTTLEESKLFEEHYNESLDWRRHKYGNNYHTKFNKQIMRQLWHSRDIESLTNEEAYEDGHWIDYYTGMIYKTDDDWPYLYCFHDEDVGYNNWKWYSQKNDLRWESPTINVSYSLMREGGLCYGYERLGEQIVMVWNAEDKLVWYQHHMFDPNVEIGVNIQDKTQTVSYVSERREIIRQFEPHLPSVLGNIIGQYVMPVITNKWIESMKSMQPPEVPDISCYDIPKPILIPAYEF